MKVTVFTSNQPRHTSLVEDLAAVADEVFVVQECNTVFPGEVADFYQRTEVMRRYFTEVLRAERAVFGPPRFLPARARGLAVKAGDLNRLDLEVLAFVGQFHQTRRAGEQASLEAREQAERPDIHPVVIDRARQLFDLFRFEELRLVADQVVETSPRHHQLLEVHFRAGLERFRGDPETR